MRVIHDDLSVCTDCIQMLANGECRECNDDRTACPVAYSIEVTWEGEEGHLVPGSEDLGFSWSACDGCGQTLGGDRHSAAFIGK